MKEISKKDLRKRCQINRNSYSMEFKSKVVNEVMSKNITLK